MGKASRRKQERLRDREDLLEALGESMSFLRRSADAYDAGHLGEAKRLAVTMRVLLHDTQVSHSILEQLGIKGRIPFLDTAGPINPDNLLHEHNLVAMRVTSTETGPKGEYFPLLDGGPAEMVRMVPFGVWWDEPVMRIDRTWSRKQLTLQLSNKEGGAHIDPRLDEDYERLARRNQLGWVVETHDEMDNTGRSEQAFQGDPVAVAVRQISHELLSSLERTPEGSGY